MKIKEMKPKMIDGFEMVKTDEEIYNIQTPYWLNKIKSVLNNRNKQTDKSNIDKCILEDNYYLKKFKPNMFEELDSDLINLQSKDDLKNWKKKFDDIDGENWRLWGMNEEGYINPYLINWWFKYFRNELKELI